MAVGFIQKLFGNSKEEAFREMTEKSRQKIYYYYYYYLKWNPTAIVQPQTTLLQPAERPSILLIMMMPRSLSFLFVCRQKDWIHLHLILLPPPAPRKYEWRNESVQSFRVQRRNERMSDFRLEVHQGGSCYQAPAPNEYLIESKEEKKEKR